MSINFRNAQLSELYDFQYGTGNTIENIGGEYPIYGSNGIVGFTNKFNSEDAPVIGHIGAYAGIVNWANGKHYVTYNGVICKIKPNINPRFGYYALLNSKLQSRLRGSTQPFVSYDLLNEVKTYLPNRVVQDKIAKVLSDLDAKIELNNKINQELEAMAKTLYDYWFVQFDFPTPPSSTSGIVGKPYKSSGGKMVYNEELKREIPEGWEVGTVEDYCRIFTGKKDVNQSLEIGKYKFFSCAPGYKYSDEKLYEGKAILVSGNGSYTGRTIFVDEGFDLYQRTYACVNKTETDYLAYIYYSMLRYMSLKINGGTHGSAIPYIVFDDIAKEIIVINHNLINKFQNIVYPLINKIMNNNKQAVELAKLRDWLLPMLMNGQVASRASATAK